MNKELLRNFIISVMDDDHGISERSFSILNKIAEQDKSLHDVVLAADAHDDRFFLNEEDAVTLNNQTSNMTTKEAELLAKFDEAIELAEEALELAQEYAGNDSETAQAIAKKISKLARSIPN